MSAQATRLENLFLLLRDGSSAQIRENAAEKLGEVAARSSDVCESILQQLRPLIVDSEWEIRVAASKCLDVVARSLRHENENVADLFALVSLGSQEASSAALNLQTVDISQVVQEGAPLLRSGGEVHAQEIADDIETSESQPHAEEEPTTAINRKQASDMLSIPSRSKRRSVHDSATGSGVKRLKADDCSDTEDVIMQSGGEIGSHCRIDESETQTKAAIVAGLVSDMFESMFDSKWEVRHGALLSLRQILLSSHFTAAVEAARPAVDEATQRNFVDKWLEECLIRCICVLALDQFVDYSADGSVSPVREVCAQVFGILLGSLSSEDTLVGYLQVVRTLFSGLTWQACHGGLLGLKYLVQAHKKHAQVLIPLFFDDIVTAFSQSDSEEDVLVLAAEMFRDFVSFLDRIEPVGITNTTGLLWRSLKLHESAGMVSASIVQALSAWHSNPTVAELLQDNAKVQAALWQNLSCTIPMLHHHSLSVRASSTTCVAAIFSRESSSSQSNSANFAKVFLPHLLLQVLLEEEESIQRSLLSAWKQIVRNLSKEELLMPVINGNLPKWMKLLWSTNEISCLNVEVANSEGTVSIADVNQSVDRLAQENLSSRVVFAEALGFAVSHVPLSSSCMTQLIRLVCDGLCSSSGERQCGVLLALSKWGYYEQHLNVEDPQEQSRRIQHLQDSIGAFLGSFAENQWRTGQSDAASEEGPVFYREQLGSLKRVVQMEACIIDIFSSAGISLQPTEKPDAASSADISRQIAEHIALFPYEKLQDHPKEFELAHFKRQDLFLVDELVQQSFSRFYHRIQGLGSSAYCVILPIPKKSGFLVKALMNSIKEEEEIAFRAISAQAIARFVVDQAHTQKKCVAKIVSNLCNSAAALIGATSDPSDSNPQHDPSPAIPPDVLKKIRVRAVGAEAALSEICKHTGDSLFETCRALEDAISKAWKQQNVDELTIQRCMHLIMLVMPHTESGAMEKCLSWLERLAQLMQQPCEDHQTRRTVAHAVAIICKNAQGQHREHAMLIVYSSIFVAFSNTGSVKTEALEAAVMVLDRIVHILGADLTPYVPSLVHYAMKTMSSQSKRIRTFAAGAFADLVPLIPLQMDLELHDSAQLLPDSLRTIVEVNAVSRSFLESFSTGKAVQHADVTAGLAPETTLRLYQQHGVDWLCFMAKNNLHGILADDMGLGKTLQTLAAMASTLGMELKNEASMPCIIVCPPIIVHHWIQEIKKYIPGIFASIIDYSTPASDRKRLRRGNAFPISGRGSTLIITTYSILRADIKYFSSVEYMYVVLDEAHLIRNPSTGLFRAVLELRASHRVALSGTPLQNNVTDLWALFEFLMPGYLGDFTVFRREYVLPITKSKERNATTKQKEQAAIAIAKLHQKVLPFILRRTKDQVLDELPPKIISNVLLPLSPLQKRLYSLASSTEEDTSSVNSSRTKNQEKDAATTNEKSALSDWKSSGKMTGLHDLLVECCDIAARDQKTSIDSASNADDTSFSPHRCLVFAHLQKTLDLTEQMLQDALPGVMYRRLDGRTSHSKRADIVQQFNADPSIDVLLLTTSVGGLGLTLTGADTVIFIEHSWNPFVDLQAMDRAHRIGQKRTVRVFRLIMEESLEEHIVNLQQFKEQVAATVVQKSDAQSSMNTNTRGVLNLLQASSSAVAAKELRASVAATKSSEGDQHVAAALPQGAQELLDQIGELWDESQYESLAFPEDE
ncbi:helicase mot1 [Phytophthora nicotianae]|uniref:Helicase mot1 n=1 Tax=Phytophthora nicotianae TaxID=4792 RepID=A0A0W8C8D2_PHYNI|nr:helicase mot1 [Phytophthora nicotianae]